MRRGHAKSRPRRPFAVPALWLMTDERIMDKDLRRAIGRLPRGSALIVRHYSLPMKERRALFLSLRKTARRRGVTVVLAGDPLLARSWGADGHHGRSRRPRGGRAWLHSAPVHNQRELRAAERAGADALLVSPLFATRSHPGAQPLGACRFAALARAAHVPVIALGGVKPGHARLVRQLGASGMAAIDGLIARAQRRSTAI